MTRTRPTNNDDVIDSRDVIEAIDDLESELAEASRIDPDWDDLTRELATLRDLRDEAADYAEDWEYGETLIRDSYFQRYAEELADDIGAIPSDAAWPLTCIDWQQAARELQIDYTAVEFDGVTYWVR